MYDKRILSQLIALTKDIKLIEPTNVPCYKSSFFAGNQYSSIPMGRIGITWWHTDKGFQLCKSIASMSVDRYESLKDADKENLIQIIKDAFRDICLGADLFNGDDIFLRSKQNLFEARIIDDVDIFSKRLWRMVFNKMEQSIGHWLIVYPLPRILTQSFQLENGNIALVRKTDTEFWEKYGSEHSIQGWDLATGSFSDGTITPFTRFSYETLIVCRCPGTADGAKFKSKLKIKRFLSVIFALLRIENGYQLTKSSAPPFTYSMQFKSKSSQSKKGIIVSSIGEMMPYYISNAELGDHIIKHLQDWYQALSNAESETANRVKKAAHFINNAMVSDDIESFINYFISLDALFGIKGDVEHSIIDGVSSCLLQPEWNQKVSWLYNLRSELVHGGSRFEKEWKDYDRYIDHFRRQPSEDIRDLAFLCVLKKLISNLNDPLP